MQSLGSMAVRLRQTPLRGCWNGFASDRTLACATITALVCGMGCLGLFVAAHIKDNLVHKAAAATAMYMDSFVAPLAQELANAYNPLGRTQAEISKSLLSAGRGRATSGRCSHLGGGDHRFQQRQDGHRQVLSQHPRERTCMVRPCDRRIQPNRRGR